MRPQTFSKVLSRLTGTGFRVFFSTCLVFAGISAYFSLWVCLVELAVILALYLYLRSGITRRKEEVLAYLEEMDTGVDSVSRRTMISSPLPVVIFRPDTDTIIWSNDRFLHLTGGREHLFETTLSNLIPAFQSQWLLDGDSCCPEPIQVGEEQYLVFGNLVSPNSDSDLMATTYWVEITDYARTAETFNATRPVLAIFQVDNYEDLSRGLEESEMSSLRADINHCLTAWLEPVQCMICRYDRDHYLVLTEAGKMPEFHRRKFSILEDIRRVQSPNGVAATLSIGIGQGADTPRKLHQFASLALDMALSRGGDQVVIKDLSGFTFIGGRSKEIERRTKIKSRVVASALTELLTTTRPIVIMGHKFPDLDVLGATAGLGAIARKLKVSLKIVRAPSPYPAEEQTNCLAALPEYQNIFISPEEARHLVKENALVIVVDTNRPEQTQVPELLRPDARIAVIDHHRRAASYIEKTVLSFHDPYASSASELVAELVQISLDPGDLKREEAEAMLAGIVLDTKAFTMRTGSRTFEIAAFLRKCGADTAEVNKFFQTDLPDTVAKFKIIQGAEPYHKTIAITLTDKPVGRIIAGQAADELLNIAGIGASFVLFPEKGQSCLSARSCSEVNVQVISEMLGGGGNGTTAGAQFPGKTPEDILPDLKAAIDRYFDEEV